MRHYYGGCSLHLMSSTLHFEIYKVNPIVGEPDTAYSRVCSALTQFVSL